MAASDRCPTCDTSDVEFDHTGQAPLRCWRCGWELCDEQQTRGERNTVISDEYRIIRVDAWNHHIGDHTRWEVQHRRTRRHKWRRAFANRFVAESIARAQLTAIGREPAEVLHDPVVLSQRPQSWTTATRGYGLLLRNGHVNDNHGHGWATRQDAEEALHRLRDGGDLGSGVSLHFNDAQVVDLARRHLTVVR
jgi:hypothetical protein